MTLRIATRPEFGTVTKLGCGPCSRNVASTFAERMSTSAPQRLQLSVFLCTVSLAVSLPPARPGLSRVPGGQCTARRAAARERRLIALYAAH